VDDRFQREGYCRNGLGTSANEQAGGIIMKVLKLRLEEAQGERFEHLENLLKNIKEIKTLSLEGGLWEVL
jgi:hypothetical protein